MPAHFLQFAILCDRLAAIGSTLEKRQAIAEYIRALEPADAARAALCLAATPFPVGDARRLNAGGALLTSVVAGLTRAESPAMHAAYRRHGDLGSAAFDLLQSAASARGEASLLPLTLEEVATAFERIAGARRPAEKKHLVHDLLARATPLEVKYVVKVMLGDLRIGVKESLIEEAIAAAYEGEIAEVRRALMLNGSLAEVVMLAAAQRLDDARMRLFHPLGFMLASPVASVDEALERFSRELAAHGKGPEPRKARKERPEPTGMPALQALSAEISEAQLPEAQLEDKYDGIRAQLHCGDRDQPGRVALFSRSREDITLSFPEIAEAFAGFHRPVILDGELLAWDFKAAPAAGVSGAVPAAGEEAGRALPFSALQSRLGRKGASAARRAEAPVIFMAFDLLYADGELLLEHPLSERRRRLEELASQEGPVAIAGPGAKGSPVPQSVPASTRASRSKAARSKAQGTLAFGLIEPATGAMKSTETSESMKSMDSLASIDERFPRFLLAPATRLWDANQLEMAYQQARARGNEGVMLKDLGSVYQPGRRGLAWLKLKRELATLDVVVTAAEYGHGKRAQVLSDYTFSVRDGEALRSIGKAYSGLTDTEIEALTELFVQNTVEDFGGIRTVAPLVVLEVAFNNIMRSTRHESGFALRFPRIVRIRQDKTVAEIDTLERVEQIYRSQNLPQNMAGRGEHGDET